MEEPWTQAGKGGQPHSREAKAWPLAGDLWAGFTTAIRSCVPIIRPSTLGQAPDSL